MGEKRYVQYDPATGEILATLSVYADDAEDRDEGYQETIAARPNTESVEIPSMEAMPDPATEKYVDGEFVPAEE